MAKSIPGVPESFTREEWGSIFEAVGVDPKECIEMTLTRCGAHVTVVARDAEGRLIVEGDAPATHRVFIPVRDEDETEGK